jgi:hypothetical protein
MTPAEPFPGRILTEVLPVNWLWLNSLLEAVLFLAITGIPLWMVIRRPDYRPASAEATGKGAPAHAGTVTVARMTDRPAEPAEICDRR